MVRSLVVPLLLWSGCGGQVRQYEPAPADSSSGGQGGEPNGGSGLNANVSLPPCKPGFKPEEDTLKTCDFVVNDLCYESKVDACACACPANKANTQCISGFPVPDGHVVVTCL
jgi:hypothetical protein